MSSFTDAMQEIVNLSEEEKVRLAGNSFLSLMPHLAQFDEKNKGLTLVLAIFGASAGADGKLTHSEVALIRAITNAIGMKLSDENVLELVKASTKEDGYKMISSLSGILDDEGRASLITLVASICAIDDTLSKEELAFIASLLG